MGWPAILIIFQYNTTTSSPDLAFTLYALTLLTWAMQLRHDHIHYDTTLYSRRPEYRSLVYVSRTSVTARRRTQQMFPDRVIDG